MAQGQKKSIKGNSGQERRNYPRYPVVLNAQLIQLLLMIIVLVGCILS